MLPLDPAESGPLPAPTTAQTPAGPAPVTAPSALAPSTDDAAPAGRFAPSPSGDLHVGNLRTALLAWAFARSSGRRFVLRIEDLDRVRAGAAERQLEDLRALGLDWDTPVDVQSTRVPLFRRIVTELGAAGLTYECFCTRRQIQEAASAPHGIPGAYPGTCRSLSAAERAERRRERTPAIRLRSAVREFTVHDYYAGPYTGPVDDMVLLRGDGTPAYNLAVVVDDARSGIDQVVRGDDLLSSAPRQAYLAALLRVRAPAYVHVPLVLGPTGARLAKRDGAVTLRQLRALGWSTADVLGWIGRSLGVNRPLKSAGDLLDHWDPRGLPRAPATFDPPADPPGR